MDLSNKNILHLENNGIGYIQFKKLLKYPEIVHGYTVGLDKDYRNIENYKQICNELKINNIVRADQKHTDNIMIINSKQNVKNTDGLITNKKGINLATVNADCILLIFYDPVKKVIANIHSGWRGTLQRISIKTVEMMKKEYECNPKDIICCMSPSIRKCHFEVDKDVYELFRNEFKELNGVIKRVGKKWHIDTIEINRKILKNIGLIEENIIDSGICSVCNKDMIHSYRGHGINSGRETMIIGIK